MLRLNNTLTRKLEEFKPINPPNIGVYSCGPTVYWNQHIGNMYAFTQWDFLVRFLRYSGYKVKWVMNITDVGHMTSDQDEGEDRMEKGAKRENLTPWQIAQKYIDQFMESMQLLNVITPDVLPRATEHIQEQIGLIKRIEANGFTYKTTTGLVFDTSKFPKYADFAKLNLEDQKAGSRVEVDPEKKNPWDFLLWVTNQPTHIMQWDSPWGRGFPGWHIECTAMSTKYLGDQFDIHTGGKEHIPVHHTNEIAQAYGAFGRQTANYWLHNEWLVTEEKMSKSLGNVILVTDVVVKGYDPMHLRYLFTASHYRTGLNFTWESLDAARNAYDRLTGYLRGWKGNENKRITLQEEDLRKIDEFRGRFVGVLSDDLSVPAALAVVWEMAKSNIPDPDKYDLILEFDQVLGLRLDEAAQKVETPQIPQEVTDLVGKREELRKQKKWEEADKVREDLEKLGWEIEDTEAGPRPRRTK